MVASTRSEPRKRNIDPQRRAEIGAEKRARTRARILSVAFDVIGRENGMFTTVDLICSAAGISRGTFYNYFESIEELYSVLSFELSHDFVDSVLGVITELADPAERTAFGIRYYLERAVAYPSWGWGMVNLSAGGPVFGAETFEQVAISVKLGIDRGVFTVPSVEAGRDIVAGSTLAAMTTILRTPQSKSYIAAMAAHILMALGVTPALAKEYAGRKMPRLKS